MNTDSVMTDKARLSKYSKKGYAQGYSDRQWELKIVHPLDHFEVLGIFIALPNIEKNSRSKAASSRERSTPTQCEGYVNLVNSNEKCLNNSPGKIGTKSWRKLFGFQNRFNLGVVEGICHFGSSGFVIKLSPAHDPFPTPELKPYEGFQEDGCSSKAGTCGPLEICDSTSIMLSNVAVDSPNNAICKKTN